MELAGKVAIVVGASQGIGRAYALALARAGATVVATARNVGSLPERGTLAEVVQAGKGEPGNIIALGCDAEVEGDVIRLVETTLANFGRIDILVNNAAIYPHYDALAIDTGEWDRNMRVNVRGPYLLMRHVVPHMKAQGAGSIVNITSKSAVTSARGTAGHVDLMLYGVTKAALDRMTTWFAEELQPFGIAVNGLSPGAVLTDTWRSIAPADAAAAEASGRGKRPVPEVMGPALVWLAGQTVLTGRLLHTDEFRNSWP